MADSSKKLGLVGMSAIVFGSMVGVGIFNIAQNMAAGASVGAVIVSWLITAVGMLLLAYTFKTLTDLRPDLKAGIYQYALEGYGNYAGFNIAWGYWLCTAFGNVAYAIMLNDALGMFFPVLLRHSWPTVLLDSALIWMMYGIVGRGVHSASIINDVMSVLKVVCLLLIIGVLAASFQAGLFTSDFWGVSLPIGGVGKQVRSTMLVTLWCFLGIEGAVVMSSRAKRSKDVGRAGLIGFFTAWSLYFLVSVLCYGVMSQPRMAALENPSVGYVLKAICGDWAYYFVAISVIVSLLGGWVAWTLLCAQVPYEASFVKIFPKQFRRLNKHMAPGFGLFCSTVAMQLFIFVVVMAEQVYMAAIEIASMMVLPAYLFTAIYLCKAAWRPDRYLPGRRLANLTTLKVVGVACVIYCCWLIYAGGLDLLMMTSLFYVPGAFFYIAARRQQMPGARIGSMFSPNEKCVACVLGVLAAASLVLVLSRL